MSSAPIPKWSAGVYLLLRDDELITSTQRLRDWSSAGLWWQTEAEQQVFLAALAAVVLFSFFSLSRITWRLQRTGSLWKPVFAKRYTSSQLLSRFRSDLCNIGVDNVGSNNTQLYGLHMIRRGGFHGFLPSSWPDYVKKSRARWKSNI